MSLRKAWCNSMFLGVFLLISLYKCKVGVWSQQWLEILVAPSILRLASIGITYELVPIFRYYSVARFNILSGTTAARRPTIWIVTSHFWLSDQYYSPERGSNLGPKHLSLLEFATWQLRPLGQHGRLILPVSRITLKGAIAKVEIKC